MPALHDLQTAFADAILTSTAGSLPSLVAPLALGAERRVQVYRNHFAISLTECLAATFPVLRALVGDAYFDRSARRFASEFPPSSPVLFEYGERFPSLLAQSAGDDFAYLADIGAFEWAINCAYHADDAVPMQPQALRSVPAERHGDLILHLHPSARLVLSAYPILDVWRANQPDSRDDRPINLGRGGIRLLVSRNGIDVGWRALVPSETAFIAALLGRSALADACAAAFAQDSGFQPGPLIAELFAGSLLTGFSLPSDPAER